MDRLRKHYGKLTPFDMPSGTVFCVPWLLRVSIALLLGAVCLQSLAAAQATPKPAADSPSIRNQPQRALTVQERKNQWFFAKSVATSMWELAMYAERLTLHRRTDRVETLQSIYMALIDIESELALNRQHLAGQHAIMDTLLSHPGNVLTADQKRAFDAYMLEVIALHQSATTVIDKDAFLKRYYGHLLAINGMTVFMDRLQAFLRAKQRQGDRAHY